MLLPRQSQVVVTTASNVHCWQQRTDDRAFYFHFVGSRFVEGHDWQTHPPRLSGVPLRILHSSVLPLRTAAPCGPAAELQPALSSLTN